MPDWPHVYHFFLVAALIATGSILLAPFFQQSSGAFLEVVIPTAPLDWNGRNQVRKTWLNYWDIIPEAKRKAQSPYSVVHHFVIGTKNLRTSDLDKLEAENEAHRDLLFIEDIEDSYNSLAPKLLRAYRRLAENTFRFLLKTDTDSFVNIPGLIDRLGEPDVLSSFYVYLGYFMGGPDMAPVFHDGKWADPDWNDCDSYVPYAGGGGYVLSYDAVNYIATNAENLRVFVNEDTNVGFWLSPLKIVRIHDRRFNSEFMSRGCRNSFLVSHAHTKKEILEMYDQFSRSHGSLICSAEFTQRLSYSYDWEVLPAHCCDNFDTH